MSKLIKIFSLIIIIAIIVLSIFWFVQKSNIENSLEDLPNILTDYDIEISYNDYKITGFPLKHIIDFDNLSLKIEYPNGPISPISDKLILSGQLNTTKDDIKSSHFSTDDNARIILNYFDKSITHAIPNLINIKDIDVQNLVHEYEVTVDKSSYAKVYFKNIPSLVAQKDDELIISIIKSIDSIYVKTKDLKYVDKKTKKKIYTVDSSSDILKVSILDDELTKYSYKSNYVGSFIFDYDLLKDIKIKDLKLIEEINKFKKPNTFKLDLDIELTYRGDLWSSENNSSNKTNQVTEVKINDIFVKFNEFSTKIQSSIKPNKNGIIPIGFVNIEVFNYINYLEEITKSIFTGKAILLNEDFDTQSASLVTNILKKTVKSLKSSDTKDSADNAVILLKTDGSGQITIGDKNMQEVMMIVMPAFSQIKSILQPKNNSITLDND